MFRGSSRTTLLFQYKSKDYWEARYQKEGPETTFDWFKSYEEIRPVLEANLPPLPPPTSPSDPPHLLVLGCGNSTLSESLSTVSNYTHVTSVDYSPTVIDAMRARSLKLGLDPAVFKMEVADIRDMVAFAADSFEAAIDKGTMDALLVAGDEGDEGEDHGNDDDANKTWTRPRRSYDPWNPPAELCAEVERYVREVYRVLKPGGVFIYITFGQPHFRRRHLELTAVDGRDHLWESVVVYTIGTAFHYYVYVCKKSQRSPFHIPMVRKSPIRLRQIALVARDVKAARESIEGAFGIELVWKDPGVGEFGLENILYAVSGNALEVVVPTKPKTTAGRLLDKRGDGGYMLIFHGEDAKADRERITKLGIRTVWEISRPHYVATHFHPADTNGVFGIPSIDSTPGKTDHLEEYSLWPPLFETTEGPSRWLSIAKRAPSSKFAYAGVTVQSTENPHMVAAQWARILDLPAELEDGQSVIRVQNVPIRFSKPIEGILGNGIAVIDVGVERETPEVAFARAVAAPGARKGKVGGVDAVMLVGVWWRFVSMPKIAKAKL
ncbi:hypothetical protein HDU93_000999 [Gonapodya sp. JEL0774]|nr:hypothetical protein HDU93_000999 [Gonapodya sp. JEL0774]